MNNFILNEGNIAYEDDYLLIIDKPAGMLVHPTVNEAGCTLYDYVTEYYARKNITANIHPVSRLDRHTSGLAIFTNATLDNTAFLASNGSFYNSFVFRKLTGYDCKVFLIHLLLA